MRREGGTAACTAGPAVTIRMPPAMPAKSVRQGMNQPSVPRQAQSAKHAAATMIAVRSAGRIPSPRATGRRQRGAGKISGEIRGPQRAGRPGAQPAGLHHRG